MHMPPETAVGVQGLCMETTNGKVGGHMSMSLVPARHLGLTMP
jgi:hypothetical protein